MEQRACQELYSRLFAVVRAFESLVLPCELVRGGAICMQPAGKTHRTGVVTRFDQKGKLTVDCKHAFEAQPAQLQSCIVGVACSSAPRAGGVVTGASRRSGTARPVRRVHSLG
jgi:hypothetical protein